MISIDIQEEAHNTSELVDLLNTIASQLEQGYTSGYYPTWSTSGEEEPEPEDE